MKEPVIKILLWSGVGLGFALLYVILSLIGVVAIIATTGNISFQWISLSSAGAGILTLFAACSIIIVGRGILEEFKK